VSYPHGSELNSLVGSVGASCAELYWHGNSEYIRSLTNGS
jgi:hypothetical protein